MYMYIYIYNINAMHSSKETLGKQLMVRENFWIQKIKA